MNLNGTWEFAMDHADTGLERGLVKEPYPKSITVPFCMESPLSGIGHTDFVAAVWYRRTVNVPTDWDGQEILLHFGAVDYDTTVWINGEEVGKHRGGHSSFSFPISAAVKAGSENTIVVRARDTRGVRHQPRGKQSVRYGNYSCYYVRTTGIWQTVWLEAVPRTHLLRPRITPRFAEGAFSVVIPVKGRPTAGSVRVTLSSGGETLVTAESPIGLDFAPSLTMVIPEPHRRLWSPEDPHLYDLTYELLDTSCAVVDHATGYAGLRGVALAGHDFLLNGKRCFQRLVLDQGYYPDGILTAPSDNALVQDIEISIASGFNGARLHQKVFEERFLYHADRLGYLVWGEFPDWCPGVPEGQPLHQYPIAFATEWLEVLERDLSHPSIIGWCALNETSWGGKSDRITELDDATRALFLAAKTVDPTRPVLDASGFSHRVPETDVYDAHDYEQDPEKFRQNHNGVLENRVFMMPSPSGPVYSVPYQGQPYFVSEFGGIWWNPNAKPGEDSWGYGSRPRTEEEFWERFEGLVAALRDDPAHFGYCYTQLTDVFQEQNGLFFFDRSPKFDLQRLHSIQTTSRPKSSDPNNKSPC